MMQMATIVSLYLGLFNPAMKPSFITDAEWLKMKG